MKIFAIIVGSFCLLALASYGAFGWLEERTLYHPEIHMHRRPLDAVAHHPLRKRIEDVYFRSEDGVLLNGWYIAARAGKPTVVFAHGNAGNLGDRYNAILMFIEKGYGFLAFDYRGYGESQGHPSETGLYRDFDAASRFLSERKGVASTQQVALGGSLGSGVVLDAASRHPYRAVIAYACFTNTPAVAAHLRDTGQRPLLNYLPLQLMRQRFDSSEKIARIQSPVIYMHGRDDAMMPYQMAEELYRKTSGPHKILLLIPHAGHNDVLEKGQSQLLDALEKLPAPSR